MQALQSPAQYGRHAYSLRHRAARAILHVRVQCAQCRYRRPWCQHPTSAHSMIRPVEVAQVQIGRPQALSSARASNGEKNQPAGGGADAGDRSETLEAMRQQLLTVEQKNRHMRDRLSGVVRVHTERRAKLVERERNLSGQLRRREAMRRQQARADVHEYAHTATGQGDLKQQQRQESERGGLGPRNNGQRTSKYRGVSKRKHRWKARITSDGKRRHIGTFDSEASVLHAPWDTSAQQRVPMCKCKSSLALAQCRFVLDGRSKPPRPMTGRQ